MAQSANRALISFSNLGIIALLLFAAIFTLTYTRARNSRVKRLHLESYKFLQVNLFQKHLFLHQLTHNMTKDFSENYMKITSSEHVVYINYFVFLFCFVLTFRTICVHNMFWRCSKLAIFMYWTHNSMNNLLSYYGLVDEKIRASDKDLPLWVVYYLGLQV